MKQIYFLTTLFCLTFISLNAQIVTLANSCDDVEGDYLFSGEMNGKPSYSFDDFIFNWTGTRWQHNRISDPNEIGMYNEADTENPPASSFLPWTMVICDPVGDITGEGTSTTLSIGDAKLIQRTIKIFPNPTSDFIKVSGLINQENYSIYNILGAKIKKGKIADNGKVNVQQFSNGIYLLKFENGNTIKFIKE